MAEKTYTYYGPMSGVTLPADDAHPKGRQIQFIRGGRVTVPDDNDYIKSLVARGYLKPVAESTEAETTAAQVPEAKPAATATPAPGTTATSGASVSTEVEKPTGPASMSTSDKTASSASATPASSAQTATGV